MDSDKNEYPSCLNAELENNFENKLSKEDEEKLLKEIESKEKKLKDSGWGESEKF